MFGKKYLYSLLTELILEAVLDEVIRQCLLPDLVLLGLVPVCGCVYVVGG